MRFLKRHSHFVLSLVLLFIFFGSLAKAQNAEPIAQTVLARMTATYATASSYQGSGVVRLVSGDSLIADRKSPFLQNIALQSEMLISFKTHYLRPNRLRFEWKISTQEVTRDSAFWFDGKRAYLWMPTEPGSGTFELTSSLNFGVKLDQALSPSLGSVFTVPTLLLKKVTVLPFADVLSMAKQVSIVREESVDGETCYVIKANLSSVPWLLWVGKESYLLRKTRTLYSARSFHPSDKSVRQSFIAEEVHTDIRINRGVPRSLFKYRPVLGPQDVDLTGKGGAYNKTHPRPRALMRKTYLSTHRRRVVSGN